jgi:hypothetical protein
MDWAAPARKDSIMTISPYSTQFMAETVLSLRSVQRSSFMLDTFFKGWVPPTGAAEISFDVEDDALGIAPFVSPLVQGKILPMPGYQVKTFKPAYIKPKTPINPLAPLVRAIGEQLGGGAMSPAQREQIIVAKTLDDHVGRIARRLELMAIDALVDGINTITGEGYDAVAVNYGRDAGHSKALTSTARWGESGVSPVSDLDDWLALVAAATGVQPDAVVMEAKAWKLYAADPALKDRRDTQFLMLPGTETRIAPGLSTGNTPGTAKLVASLDGGALKIYVYQQQYKHPVTGALTNMIPDYSVFVGSTDMRCTGTRYFGTIIDPQLDYQSGFLTDPATGMPIEMAPKTWTTEDPGQRIVMTQCAPLTALTRPNATLYATVR